MRSNLGLSKSSLNRSDANRNGQCKVIYGKPINFIQRKKEVDFIKRVEESKNPKIPKAPCIIFGMNNK